MAYIGNELASIEELIEACYNLQKEHMRSDSPLRVRMSSGDEIVYHNLKELQAHLRELELKRMTLMGVVERS